ncbi:MAG: hypothetical protein M0R05_02785 [Bacilli bacterium]|nr:hypothetical protein [Bacilli bacterium]MDD4077343.1 hypothetical protein [Bacilli bacterium]MDD4387687.1 hypothetical protein [Bacilli bacterium]
MHKLLNTLKTKKFSLIASLPENTYQMARLAWEAGADAIKVHINVFHRASQNTFGTLGEIKETFEKIITDSPVPVGVVAGEDPQLVEGIIDEIVAMGFDFVSLYGHFMPASLIMRRDITAFFAINSDYSYEEIRHISQSFFGDILELSVIAPEKYGERLTARDLVKYNYIATCAHIPTVVPTQKLIYPSDVQVLYRTGVNAVMVGAVCYGKDPEKMERVIKGFRREIDKL